MRLIDVTKRALTPKVRARVVADLVANVLKVYDQADSAIRAEGRAWYTVARDHAIGIALRHSVTVEQAASLIALTSPRQHWDTNLAMAESIASGEGKPFFTRQHEPALRILADRDCPEQYVSGPKVCAFLANILGDETQVTIDIWACRVALADAYLSEREYGLAIRTVTRFAMLTEAYKLAAYARNVTPMTMQATCWVMARDHNGLGEHRVDYLPDAY